MVGGPDRPKALVLFRARHLSGYQLAWSTRLGEGDATPVAAKAVLRTMEGVNWQAAPEPKKPRPRKTVNKANKSREENRSRDM